MIVFVGKTSAKAMAGNVARAVGWCAMNIFASTGVVGRRMTAQLGVASASVVIA